MKYLLRDIRIPVDAPQDLETGIHHALKAKAGSVLSWKLVRKALDTRKTNHLYYVYTIEIETGSSLPVSPDLIPVIPEKDKPIQEVKVRDKSPFIVGMGPAGLFFALAMVEKGLSPVLFDRGSCMEERAKYVSDFWQKGILNPDSNVQFGEGGAGAFSDGKLTSRTRNSITEAVFEYLIRFGASESIRYDALPHLGTDGIRQVVAGIKEYLLSKGCRFEYKSKLTDLDIADGKVKSVTINNDKHKPELIVLALGNAARDTFQLLAKRNVLLQSKPFAVGFRISHPQDWINRIIYGNETWSEKLGAASYRLTSKQSGKGTYTFCMCPGGHVIAASSEPGTIVTNGMSYANRKHAFGNSALVTVVNELDYGSGMFDGMQFQTDIERKPYLAGYLAPYQTAADFMADRLSPRQKVDCLFPDSHPYQLSELFTNELNLALKNALKYFDRVMPGFIQEGMLIGPETRTSSPLRIVRDPVHQNCSGISNLYAVGEGSGYAGGIISSAADGYRIGSKFAL